MEKIWLEKYEQLCIIGAGGMGKVYLARDRNLDRMVVVKESENHFLLCEMEILKELEHKGLPHIYDCFTFEGKIFLVMEYIEGMSLRQYLDKHKKVSEHQAVKWIVELCEILMYLHGRRPAVIYRDLKPENIMIRQNGELKLIDFGGAFRLACGRKREEMCIGTAGYNPPDQWKETGGDVTWDIYGLGAVLHEMLTGANPSTPPCERRSLAYYDRSLSSGLDKIIKKCTAKKATDRYLSMEQLKDDLLHYRRRVSGSSVFRMVGKYLYVFMMTGTVLSFMIPFIMGVPENQIPFPYLERPLIFLMTSQIIRLMIFQFNKKHCLYRQEKNIYLTEKRFLGLLSLMLFTITGVLVLSFAGLSQPFVCAKEEDGRLWVEMRDEQGRKMLLKEDAVYKTDKKVQFEIPADQLPRQKLAMQLVAVGEDGDTYSSRVFYIQAQDEAATVNDK